MIIDVMSICFACGMGHGSTTHWRRGDVSPDAGRGAVTIPVSTTVARIWHIVTYVGHSLL